MRAYTVTFKTPGGSWVAVTVSALTPRLAKWVASNELKSLGYSRQCHMWPSTMHAA